MSIELQNLTKEYDHQVAVDHLSFSVQPNEVVGFLGPNGAGKSTTMKILTSYLAPSSGTAYVSGHNVVEAPQAVKRLTGYLPENTPLYLDMYVHEYLRFVAKINNISGKQVRNRVREMIDICDLSKEQNKLIGALSKGYRQRLGLAQALIHDPEVLILDEPTAGLDPNQILEVRNLVRSVSDSKTVLLSTHIMQEVEAVCDRVLIIDQGKLVADDTVKNISTSFSSKDRLQLETSIPLEIEDLLKIKGVSHVDDISADNKNRYVMDCQKNSDARRQLIRFLADKDIDIIELRSEEHSLEDVFRNLTSTKG